MKKEYKFEIKGIDKETDEEIYTDSASSMESLEEKFYKINRAIRSYEAGLEPKEEDI